MKRKQQIHVYILQNRAIAEPNKMNEWSCFPIWDVDAYRMVINAASSGSTSLLSILAFLRLLGWKGSSVIVGETCRMKVRLRRTSDGNVEPGWVRTPWKRKGLSLSWACYYLLHLPSKCYVSYPPAYWQNLWASLQWISEPRNLWDNQITLCIIKKSKCQRRISYTGSLGRYSSNQTKELHQEAYAVSNVLKLVRYTNTTQ